MIKVIIIDDEPLARHIILEYLGQRNDVTVVEECNNGFEGIKAVMQHKPDLIFLDVQMPKINGFEMLELCEYKPGVIFTTAFDEYALKAFEVNAIDYLLKPFNKERFDTALKKWIENHKETGHHKKVDQLITDPNIQKDHNRIVVKNGQQIRIIPVEEIIYLEACDDYVKIIVPDGICIKKQTMAYYETHFEPYNFLRVHRSYLLQLNQIAKVEPYEKNGHLAILKNGSRIPLSRSGYAKLKEALGI